MWIFLWIIIVLAVIGAIIWSYHIIFEQKRAWGAFAKKYNLTCTSMGYLKAPEVTGQIKGRTVNIYSIERYAPETDVRTVTSMVEVFLKNDPGMYAAVSSPGFIDYMNDVQLPMPFIVDHPDWPQNVLSRTFENETAAEWFSNNETRINAIKKMSVMPFDTLFVANDMNSFIGVRTSHPLTDPRRINQIMGNLFKIADMFDN
jgi:hypothetical protein